MKNEINLTITGNIGRLFGLLVLLAAAMVSQALARDITKTKEFRFGAGTQYSTSNKRTFWAPCGVGMDVKVKFSHLDSAVASNDVPIVIEVKKPGIAGTEGELAATRNETAQAGERTVNFDNLRSNQGCAQPWIVRVRSANGPSARAVTGNITITYNVSVTNVSVEGGLIELDKGTSEMKKLGGLSGLKQGKIIVTANWEPFLFNIPRLKFELIDPNGVSVKSDTGYPINALFVRESAKMKLTFQVPICLTGQWKLKITNNSNIKANNIDPKVTFEPDCPD